MKVAIYLMRCLTDIILDDKSLNTSLKVENFQGVGHGDLVGDFYIAPAIIKREFKHTLMNRGFLYVDYVSDNNHFFFHRADLIAYPGISDDGQLLIHLKDGWQTYIEAVINNLQSSQTQPSIFSKKSIEKIRAELEHLPIIKKRKDYQSDEKGKNFTGQILIPEGACFIFLVSYDDDDKFGAFDQMILQGDFRVGSDDNINGGFCKIINIS